MHHADSTIRLQPPGVGLAVEQNAELPRVQGPKLLETVEFNRDLAKKLQTETDQALLDECKSHLDSLAKLLQEERLAQGGRCLCVLRHPVAQELLLVNRDLAVSAGGEPQVGPEMDSGEVDLGMTHVACEVLTGDAGPAIAGVVLQSLVSQVPVTLVTHCDHVVRVNLLGVVSHDLNPALQASTNGEMRVLGFACIRERSSKETVHNGVTETLKVRQH